MFLGAGLCARYLLKWPRVSAFIQLCVPLIDLVLLWASVEDLRGGATATFAHGLAAAYLGFTVGFGHTTLAWADTRFAFRFADGPPPTKPPQHGRPLLAYELKWFGRCVLACGVTILLVHLAIEYVADHARSEALQAWLVLPIGTAAAWLLFGPLWSLAFYWRPPPDQSDG